MINELEIKNYRGLKNLKLDNLSRINLIIAPNNFYKTSILEAIYLYSSSGDLQTLLSQYILRDYFKSSEQPFKLSEIIMSLLWLFNKENKNSHNFTIEGIEDSLKKKLDISLKETNEIFAKIYELKIQNTINLKKDEFKNSKTFLINYDKNSSYQVFRRQRFGRDLYRFIDKIKEDIQINGKKTQATSERLKKVDEVLKDNPIFINTNAHLDKNLLLKRYSEVVRNNEVNNVINLLKIIDKNILGFNILTDSSDIDELETELFISHKKFGHEVPLSTYGEGMKKLISMAFMFSDLNGEVVCIDEFENALHIKALKNLADWINKVSKKFKTQFFLTTHSIECIDAFIDITKDINLIKLIEEDGNLKAENIPFQDLEYIRKNIGLEFR